MCCLQAVVYSVIILFHIQVTLSFPAGVKMRQKPPHMMSVAQRKMSSQEEINKRLSLPADLKLPDNFVEKLAVSPTLDGPLSRATRRQSLSEIGGYDNNNGNPEVFCSIFLSC